MSHCQPVKDRRGNLLQLIRHCVEMSWQSRHHTHKRNSQAVTHIVIFRADTCHSREGGNPVLATFSSAFVIARHCIAMSWQSRPRTQKGNSQAVTLIVIPDQSHLLLGSPDVVIPDQSHLLLGIESGIHPSPQQIIFL